MRGLKKSIRSFRKFNRKEPNKLVKLNVDLKTPLIRIGEVPEIMYISTKEGKKVAYRHITKHPMPVLYAHPDGTLFVMIGGRVKVKDWLYN